MLPIIIMKISKVCHNTNHSIVGCRTTSNCFWSKKVFLTVLFFSANSNHKRIRSKSCNSRTRAARKMLQHVQDRSEWTRIYSMAIRIIHFVAWKGIPNIHKRFSYCWHRSKLQQFRCYGNENILITYQLVWISHFYRHWMHYIYW